MAQFKEAFLATMKWEDPKLSGVVTDDSGGITRWGISKRAFPDVDVANLSLAEAEAIYHDQYWLPLYDQIKSQSVANKIYDMGVNMGVRVAVRLCQRALIGCGELIVVDGRFGPTTLNAVNRQEDVDLLPELRNKCVERYMAIIEDNPKLKIYEKGWMRRAKS